MLDDLIVIALAFAHAAPVWGVAVAALLYGLVSEGWS